MKHVIKDLGYNSEFSCFFDGDMFNEHSGDYNNTVFIITMDRGRFYGFNIDEFNRVMEQVNAVIDGFNDVEDRVTDYEGRRVTYKDIMTENDIPYNSMKCHKLKIWYEISEQNDVETLVSFLTITTGKTWNVISVTGYCQGDYCEVVYCEDNNSRESMYTCGELWLGCGSEYSVTDYEDDGTELNTFYGYYLSDSEKGDDDDVKRKICEYACIDPKETQLELIDGYSTHTT